MSYTAIIENLDRKDLAQFHAKLYAGTRLGRPESSTSSTKALMAVFRLPQAK